MRLHPRTGRNIRRRGNPSTRPDQSTGTGRYLSLHERLLIADLLRQDVTLRAIAAELGRSTSTISRELSRHRDQHGRYQPHQAEHAAARQRLRPRQPKLVLDDRLRQLVQRKLNRYWSPEQIAGWLRTTRSHEAGRTVCTETIYRALVVPGARCLHDRYTARLRTGRRLRRAHHITRSLKDGAVRNMTSIRDRPEAVAARVEPGHWEGDLIIGLGSASAMITLRERVTHYGIIVNLPGDHTALTVNAALQQVFDQLPPHLTRTLTWDQGSEMARHQELAAGDRPEDLLRRPQQPMAAGRERELQRPRQTVLPQEHGPVSTQRRARHRHYAPAERPSPEEPRLSDAHSTVPRRTAARLTSGNRRARARAVRSNRQFASHCCCVDRQNSPPCVGNFSGRVLRDPVVRGRA
jgi:IS30 family transposase